MTAQPGPAPTPTTTPNTARPAPAGRTSRVGVRAGAPTPSEALSLPPQLARIGGTPLLDLSQLLPDGGALAGGGRVRVLGKAEMTNPGGSVKDRAALSMVLDAEARGVLSPGGPRRILDATSGNTGIAYAMIGAARGYGVTLCLPDNASPERKRILRAYGADLVITDPLEGTDGAIVEARRLAGEEAERYAYLDQYSNPANPAAHETGTGPEILRQAEPGPETPEGGVGLTHFITGLGTSGTFMGVGRFLRREAPAVRLISVQPDGPLHGLEGMKHMESALVPAIYDPGLADEERRAATEAAHAEARRLARRMGLLVGPSAAANAASALALGHELVEAGEPATVVTVLCDGAEKYLSESFWDEPGDEPGEEPAEEAR